MRPPSTVPYITDSSYIPPGFPRCHHSWQHRVKVCGCASSQASSTSAATLSLNLRPPKSMTFSLIGISLPVSQPQCKILHECTHVYEVYQSCAVCWMVKGHTQSILPVNKFVGSALTTDMPRPLDEEHVWVFHHVGEQALPHCLFGELSGHICENFKCTYHLTQLFHFKNLSYRCS